MTGKTGVCTRQAGSIATLKRTVRAEGSQEESKPLKMPKEVLRREAPTGSKATKGQVRGLLLRVSLETLASTRPQLSGNRALTA